MWRGIVTAFWEDYQPNRSICIAFRSRYEDCCDYAKTCIISSRNGDAAWNNCRLFSITMGGKAFTAYSDAERLINKRCDVSSEMVVRLFHIDGIKSVRIPSNIEGIWDYGT